ncbi:MAG: GNAT family N-acetyltransferase [Bacilli bacterium]
MLKIVPVEQKNREAVLHLSVHSNQANWIETPEQCLKEAEENAVWHPVALYEADELVGFAMYGRFAEEGPSGRLWMDRLLIDQAYQGKGYGRQALNQLIRHLFNVYEDETIYLSIYPENTVGIRMYESFGFAFNGELDTKGEQIMVLTRKSWSGE